MADEAPLVEICIELDESAGRIASVLEEDKPLAGALSSSSPSPP